jgi:hypothetical protein
VALLLPSPGEMDSAAGCDDAGCERKGSMARKTADAEPRKWKREIIELFVFTILIYISYGYSVS